MAAFTSALYPTTAEALAHGVPESQVELYKRYAYQQAFGIDRWYEQLREHTFETWFITLTADDIETLLSGASECRGQPLAAVRRWVEQGGASSLRQRLQASFDEVGEPAFVKLNTRSPKDVVIDAFDEEDVVRRVTSDVARLLRTAPRDEQDAVSRLITAFVTSCTDMLRCEDAVGALALLLRSRRMREDLGKVRAFGAGAVPASITLRRWEPAVAACPEGELRGFVHGGTLNALSQYDDATLYPRLLVRRDAVAARVRAFFDGCCKAQLGAAGFESFVIDFWLDVNCADDGLRTAAVRVVELNPFHIGAGACLFSWRDDREKFLHGPFEFRVVEAVPPPPTEGGGGRLECLPVRWERHLRATAKQVGLALDGEADSANRCAVA